MSQNAERTVSENGGLHQTPVPERLHTKWIGVVLTFFLPGITHVLCGKRKMGICWFLSGMILGLLTLFLAGLPGTGFLWMTLLCLVVMIGWYIAVLKFSYRSILKLSCLGWIFLIVFIVGFNVLLGNLNVFLARTYLTERYQISGKSMEPTLLAPSSTSSSLPEFSQDQSSIDVADQIIVNKWIYRFRNPKRGELVLLRTDHIVPDAPPTTFVVRVVGLPGETVEIQSPDVLVNGEKLTDPPIFQVMASRQAGYSGYLNLKDLDTRYMDAGVSFPITLGPDEYFLLGDNSPVSFDCRVYGPIPRKDIIGRAIWIYSPFSRIGQLK